MQEGLLRADPGYIFDFSNMRPSEIFNQAILPRVQGFSQPEENPVEASIMADKKRQHEFALDAFRTQEDGFMKGVVGQGQAAPGSDLGEYAVQEGMDYNTSLNKSAAANLTDFVKEFEGYNPNAFGDYKQTSIGYGTRARKGETSISKEDAELRLAQELGNARKEVEAVNSLHKYDFTPHEMDALTSFAYNVGNIGQLTDNGKRSKEVIAEKLLEYNKAGGKVLPGLQRRREAEYTLFTKGY